MPPDFEALNIVYIYYVYPTFDVYSHEIWTINGRKIAALIWCMCGELSILPRLRRTSEICVAMLSENQWFHRNLWCTAINFRYIYLRLFQYVSKLITEKLRSRESWARANKNQLNMDQLEVELGEGTESRERRMLIENTLPKQKLKCGR